MSVKKPFEKKDEKQVDIHTLISKGAHVMEDNAAKEKKDWCFINLRLPKNMFFEIEEALKNRVGISRNGWILEAIRNKLEKL